jgi:hypothetical protein
MTETRLTQLRGSLTELQRSMLDRAWMNLVERGKPISTRAFFHAHPRDQAEPAYDALGGKVIIQHYVDGVSSLSPTLLGALLSSNGRHLEDILCRCLQFVREKYEDQPELQSLSSELIQSGCALKSEELEELRLMLSLAYHTLVVFGGGSQTGGPWTLQVRDEVDQLRTVNDWRAYVHAEIMKNFDPSFPVSEAKRAGLQPQWTFVDRPETRSSSVEVASDLRMTMTHALATSIKEHFYVDQRRLEELRAAQSDKWDLKRLIRMCEELNSSYEDGSYIACSMLVRSIVDHVPPIFGKQLFAEVASNYAGSKSFRASMFQLDRSLRNLADGNLHTHIRRTESLPTETQVRFWADLDKLLEEIVRILAPRSG